MLPRAAWRDGRARYVRPTTRPNSRSDVNAARPRSAPAAHQHALARTWRSGQTHPCTPLTYNDDALLPQVWTAASASTTALVVTMARA